MDQDDTFRVLRQRPYDEVKQKIIELYHLADPEFGIEINKVIKDNGWTREEWSKELSTRNKYG